MEAEMYAPRPTNGEEKWQNQVTPHQVYQKVLLELQNIEEVQLRKRNTSYKQKASKQLLC